MRQRHSESCVAWDLTFDRAALATSKASSTLASISAIKEESGLSDDDIEDLVAKGYTTIRLFARAPTNVDKLIERIVEPYVVGVTIDLLEHKSERHADITETVFFVAWEEANLLRDREFAATVSAPLPPLAAQEHGPNPPAQKAPVVLPLADWQRGVDRWEQQWTPKREFPTSMLTGSDFVLARLLWERNVSRVFTPLGLTEVVCTRAFNLDGTININRVDKPQRDAALRISATGVETESATAADTELGSKWDTADAIDANGWALRWAEYASDPVWDDWRNWLLRLLRETGFGLKPFSYFYLVAGWRIAMAMRGGVTWDEAVTKLMADANWTSLHKSRAVEATSTTS